MNPLYIIGLGLAGVALLLDAKKPKTEKPLTKETNEGSPNGEGDAVSPQTEEEEISENE